MNEHTPQLQLQ